MHSWIDGQDAAAVNLQNRGLAYGDGLFETIAVRGGRPSLLALHLEMPERLCGVGSIAKDLGEQCGVLDSHRGALCRERRHGVRGVADQNSLVSSRPGAIGAFEEWPHQRLVRLVQQAADIGVPAGKGVEQALARHGVSFTRPALRRHSRRERAPCGRRRRRR